MLSVRHFVNESFIMTGVNSPESLISDTAQHEKLLKELTLSADVLAGFARGIDAKADFMKGPEFAKQLDDICTKVNVALGAIRYADKANGVEETPQLGPVVIKGRRPKESREWLAYITYRAFMELYPFVVPQMNGIVGRAVWLWVMGGSFEQPTFLQCWHDQSLRFGGVAEVEKGTKNASV